MTVLCNSCGKECEDYHELALHIMENKKGHQRGKKWASAFLLRTNRLNARKDLPQRAPMTDEEKESLRDARAETRRELSGKVSLAKVFCPQCKQVSVRALPVEFAQNNQAWRLPNGTLVVSCPACSGRSD